MSYNYFNEEGKVRLVYKAEDPDGDNDTLLYTLFIGADATTALPVFTGREQSYCAEHLRPSTRYYWRLRVRDLSGDSIESSGTFITAAALPPPKGMKLLRSRLMSFNMGQAGADSSEIPMHTVAFSYDFWMDSTEVTAHDFSAVLGFGNSSSASGSELPAAHCTWYDAALYCNARSKSENKDTVYSYQSIIGTKGDGCALSSVAIDLSAYGYRLPTEAEWEYACRGGAPAPAAFFWGNDQADAETYAWVMQNSSGRMHPVASKRPNNFGLYDMSGNLSEWCNDWFGAGYYTQSPSADPMGPANGQERVIRGGSFEDDCSIAASGKRNKMKPEASSVAVGFRVVLINR